MSTIAKPALSIATAALLATTLTPLWGCSNASAPVEKTNTAAETGYADCEMATEEACDVYWIEEPPYNTEEYAAVDETGFISTLANPLSTVSADVDTASYCNVRRMIEDGWSLDEVPTGAVRIEEMLNYFDYNYPAPANGERFSITAAMGDCPWNSQTKLLTLGFATAPYDPAASAGSNLVFLIDVSGSMDSPDKLDLLQDSFDVLVDQLGPDDRVSIVTYASEEHVVLEGASGDDKRTITRAVDRLRADGCTDGQRGLAMAYEVAQDNYIEGGVNRIIMASDGDLNVGITSESDLHDYVDKQRETGIYLSVLGFGSGNYKDTKMEVLADHGNGSYHYIDCIEEAERVFEQDLTANIVPFADDVKVQVEFNPAQVKGYRLIGYENREMSDESFTDDAVDAGDVGPGAQFTVAYEVVPVDSDFEVAVPDLKYGSAAPDSTSSELASVALRYRAFDDGQVHQQDLALREGSLSPCGDWQFAAAVIEYGMVLRDSEFKGTSTLGSVEDLIAGCGNERLTDRAGFAELVAATPAR